MLKRGEEEAQFLVLEDRRYADKTYTAVGLFCGGVKMSCRLSSPVKCLVSFPHRNSRDLFLNNVPTILTSLLLYI